MSYWVAVLFLIGSLLFCFGGGFDYVRAASATELRDGATVMWPYFVGGLFCECNVV